MSIAIACFVTLLLNLIAILWVIRCKATKENPYFLGFAVSPAIWIFGIYLIHFFSVEHFHPGYLEQAIRFTYVASLFIPLYLFKFFYFFDNKKPSPKEKKGLWCLNAYVLTLSGLFFSGTNLYIAPVIENSLYTSDMLGKYYGFYAIYFIALLLLAFGCGYFKRRNLLAVSKRKLDIALNFSWAGIFLGTMTNVILPIFDIYFFQFEAVLFSLFFTIPTCYSLTRVRFVNFTILMHSVVSSLTNLMLYLVPVVLGFYHYSSILNTWALWKITALSAIYVLLILFCWSRTLNIIRQGWNFVFFLGKNHPLEKIQHCCSSFRDSIYSGLDVLAKSLNLDGIEVLYAGLNVNSGKKSSDLQSLVNHFQTTSSQELIRPELEYKLSRTLSPSPKLQRIKNILENQNLSAVLPVTGENDELISLILLKEAQNHHDLSTQEVEAIKNLLNDSAPCFSKEQKKSSSIESKKEFLTGLMHEIQTPLMMARNVSGMIEWQKLCPQDQKFIKDAEANLVDLNHKLGRISEASQWQAGLIPIQKTFISFQELFTFVFDDLGGQAKQVSVSIEPELQKTLFSFDVKRMKEAFVELIRNGLFFNESKRPKVKTHVEKQGGEIIITFSDNGIGIPSEERERIFDLLVVLDESRNEATSGIGTGLTIVKGIIEAHGGSVSIIQRNKKGTHFEVRLVLGEFSSEI